jgi:hypothetical protein
MSGERPSPLWPEGLRKELKLRPVENQKPKALTEGVAVPVAKEPSLAEQKDRERLSKPPPAESPVQAQAEPQAPKRKRPPGQNQETSLPLHKHESKVNASVQLQGEPGPHETYEHFYTQAAEEFLNAIPQEFWVPVLRGLYSYTAETLAPVWRKGQELAIKRDEIEGIRTYKVARKEAENMLLARFPKKERPRVRIINKHPGL